MSLFGLEKFWVIWSKTYNWVIKKCGTHTIFFVWLDFLMLFSSLKLKNFEWEWWKPKTPNWCFHKLKTEFQWHDGKYCDFMGPTVRHSRPHMCSNIFFFFTFSLHRTDISSLPLLFSLFFFKLGSFNCFSFSYLFFSSSRLGSFIFFSFFSFSFFHFGFFSSFSSRNDGRGLRFQLWFAF